MILIGGATVAGAFLVVCFPPQFRFITPLIADQGKVGIRAAQRFQAMPKAPRGLKSLPKGGFEAKMTRREAALIVAIK